jgi:hypothetical protein
MPNEVVPVCRVRGLRDAQTSAMDLGTGLVQQMRFAHCECWIPAHGVGGQLKFHSRFWQLFGMA